MWGKLYGTVNITLPSMDGELMLNHRVSVNCGRAEFKLRSKYNPWPQRRWPLECLARSIHSLDPIVPFLPVPSRHVLAPSIMKATVLLTLIMPFFVYAAFPKPPIGLFDSNCDISVQVPGISYAITPYLSCESFIPEVLLVMSITYETKVGTRSSLIHARKHLNLPFGLDYHLVSLRGLEVALQEPTA